MQCSLFFLYFQTASLSILGHFFAVQSSGVAYVFLLHCFLIMNQGAIQNVCYSFTSKGMTASPYLLGMLYILK